MSRRPGRPSIVQGTLSAPASARLPLPLHDELVKLAYLRRVPIGRVIRDAIRDYVSKNRPVESSSVS